MAPRVIQTFARSLRRTASPCLATVLTGGLLLLVQGIVPAAGQQIPGKCVALCGSGSSTSGSGSSRGSTPSSTRTPAQRQQQAEQEMHEANDLAVEYFRKGDWANAIKYFKLALESSPDDPVILDNLRRAQAKAHELADSARRAEEERRRQAELERRRVGEEQERQRRAAEEQERRRRGVRIGAAGGVRGEVLAKQPDGSWKQLRSGMTVYSYDSIRTGPTGGLQVLLLDQTTFTIGADTDIVLADFVYDPDGRPASATVTVSMGVVRFVTGKIARERSAIRFRMPGVAVGIRGTDFVAKYDSNTNTSRLYLREGELEVTAKSAQKAIRLSAGRAVVLDETGALQERPMSDHEWEEAVRLLGSSK